MSDVLISAQELHEQLAGTEEDRPVVLDVRWVLGDPDGYGHFLDRRIPGSLYADLNADLAAAASPAEGRHPLPDPADFQATARRWGLRQGGHAVVLDDNGGLAAARAWWLLRWAGFDGVRLLDGGLKAWVTAGYELEGRRWAGFDGVRLLDGGLKAWVTAGYELEGRDAPLAEPGPGDVVLGSGRMPTVDIDGAAGFPKHGVLFDARAGERYRGETEPIDPRAGHVPGATSAPTGENLAADGRFMSPQELRARFAALGVDPDEPGDVAVYCGSGVTAAHQVAALAVAGVDAVLYPGSWSQWSNDDTRPVATGDGSADN